MPTRPTAGPRLRGRGVSAAAAVQGLPGPPRSGARVPARTPASMATVRSSRGAPVLSKRLLRSSRAAGARLHYSGFVGVIDGADHRWSAKRAAFWASARSEPDRDSPARDADPPRGLRRPRCDRDPERRGVRARARGRPASSARLLPHRLRPRRAALAHRSHPRRRRPGRVQRRSAARLPRVFTPGSATTSTSTGRYASARGCDALLEHGNRSSVPRTHLGRERPAVLAAPRASRRTQRFAAWRVRRRDVSRPATGRCLRSRSRTPAARSERPRGRLLRGRAALHRRRPRAGEAGRERRAWRARAQRDLRARADARARLAQQLARTGRRAGDRARPGARCSTSSRGR